MWLVGGTSDEMPYPDFVVGEKVSIVADQDYGIGEFLRTKEEVDGEDGDSNKIRRRYEIRVLQEPGTRWIFKMSTGIELVCHVSALNCIERLLVRQDVI